MQVDHRVFVLPFPIDEKQQRGSRDDREGQNEVRLEPVVALSFIQDNLQRAQTQSHQAEADVVDSRF